MSLSGSPSAWELAESEIENVDVLRSDCDTNPALPGKGLAPRLLEGGTSLFPQEATRHLEVLRERLGQGLDGGNALHRQALVRPLTVIDYEAHIRTVGKDAHLGSV